MPREPKESAQSEQTSQSSSSSDQSSLSERIGLSLANILSHLHETPPQRLLPRKR